MEVDCASGHQWLIQNQTQIRYWGSGDDQRSNFLPIFVVVIKLISHRRSTNCMNSKEERANFLTHAPGLVLAVIAWFILMQITENDQDGWRRYSFMVYGLSVIFLFASSTLYHATANLRTKRTLQIIDHIAIYLLIAGTYTPFLLGPLRDSWGWTLLIIIWSLAITGSIMKIWLTGRFQRISTAIYLGMGWLALVAIKPLVESVPLASLIWLLAGGLFYSFGVYFYHRPVWRYHHAVWHIFVLVGSACHFVSISRYL